MSKKIILIYSGGLDSTVLLNSLLHDGHEVKCLSINYGQRHRRELTHARCICAAHSVEHRVADLSTLKEFLGGSSQTDDSVAVPHGSYDAPSMKLTVVPNRNALMLSVAFAWAISLKYDAVAYAAHAGDHEIYPDCRESFTTPFAEAMRNADWHQVELLRPFLKMTKGDIVKRGNNLYASGPGGDMAASYSCYEGGEFHCGQCGTCQERRAAFIAAGVQDFTRYSEVGIQALPDSQLPVIK